MPTPQAAGLFAGLNSIDVLAAMIVGQKKMSDQ
jgi:hypothetical protein